MAPKRFNPLIDEPRKTVEVGGTEYEIQTDYRQALAYFRALEDQDADQTEKTLLGLRLFFGDKIQRGHVEGLSEALRWFLNCGQPESKPSQEEKVFDLLEDSGRIYAAFLQVYQINLRKVRMHWWIFCELLEGLPSGTHLANVIDIRSRPLPKGTSPEAKEAAQRLLRAKARYKLGADHPGRDPMSQFLNFLKGIAK
jgi:hypothetical protein